MFAWQLRPDTIPKHSAALFKCSQFKDILQQLLSATGPHETNRSQHVTTRACGIVDADVFDVYPTLTYQLAIYYATPPARKWAGWASGETGAGNTVRQSVRANSAPTTTTTTSTQTVRSTPRWGYCGHPAQSSSSGAVLRSGIGWYTRPTPTRRTSQRVTCELDSNEQQQQQQKSHTRYITPRHKAGSRNGKKQRTKK